ncbi:MAG: hypothetical protein ACLFWH_01965 [Actinomycetota bacterium]
MTSQQDQLALRSQLEEILGQKHAATLMTMLPQGNNLATKDDLVALRDELKGDIGDLRSEISSMRSEMEHRFATRDDLLELRRDFDVSLRAFVRTFIATQAGTVVGMTGIFYALVRLT